MSDTVTWVDGIGPPLEQLEEDYACLPDSGPSESTDVLALIAEVKRLRGLFGRLRNFMDYTPTMKWQCENECLGCRVEMVEASLLVAEALGGGGST